jgi:hypothetical protein
MVEKRTLFEGDDEESSPHELYFLTQPDIVAHSHPKANSHPKK